MNKLVEFCEGVERSILGNTWALEEMTLLGRLRFFRDTGEWPGVYSKPVTEIHFSSIISQELEEGSRDSLEFAKRLLQRTQEAKLNLDLPNNTS